VAVAAIAVFGLPADHGVVVGLVALLSLVVLGDGASGRFVSRRRARSEIVDGSDQGSSTRQTVGRRASLPDDDRVADTVAKSPVAVGDDYRDGPHDVKQREPVDEAN